MCVLDPPQSVSSPEMSSNWESEIPIDLQDDFRRQIDERINSAIMDMVAVNPVVDEDALEIELDEKFTLEYLEMYRTNRWPPQVASLQETAVVVAPNHWFCFRCDEKNSDTFATCRNCGGFRDDLSDMKSPAELDSWPPIDLVSDSKERFLIREKLVDQLRLELDTENPLTDIRVCEEEFRSAVDRLKKVLLV